MNIKSLQIITDSIPDVVEQEPLEYDLACVVQKHDMSADHYYIEFNLEES